MTQQNEINKWIFIREIEFKQIQYEHIYSGDDAHAHKLKS